MWVFPPKVLLNSTYIMRLLLYFIYLFLPSQKHFPIRGKLEGAAIGTRFLLIYLQPRPVHVSQDFVAPSVGHHEHFIGKYLRSEEKKNLLEHCGPFY